MNGETTASKVNRLLQKSRQAFRIYSSMSKSAKAEHNEYADMQAVEWKNINAELVRQLTHVIEKYSAKNLNIQIARMRDIMLSDYRRVEAELNAEHREVIACAQRADFIRVAQLSRILISKKAFVQAAQAASHELSLIIDDKIVNSRDESAHIVQSHNIQTLAHNIQTLAHNMQTPALIKEKDMPVDGINSSSIIQPNSGNNNSGSYSHSNHQLTNSSLANNSIASSSEDRFVEDENVAFPRMAKVIPLRR